MFSFNLSSLFARPSVPNTRFRQCNALESFNLKLDDLRKQVEKLHNAAQGQAVSSLDFRKHLILSHLLNEIDEKIKAFNEEGDEIINDENNNTASIINFVKETAQIIKFTRNKFEHTLLQPRDGTKSFFSNSVSTLLYGSAVAGGLFTASPLVGCGGLYLANKVEGKALEATGLNNQRTTSINILNELSDVLTQIGLNLNLAQYWNRDILIEDFPPEFCCIITQVELEDPVVCLLDEQTYDRKAITKWLNENRNSPFNRNMMKPDQKVEDVLVRNRPLADYLERIRNENPTMTDERYPTLRK